MCNRKSFYRILLSLVIILLAVQNILPIHDRIPEQYLASCVTHDRAAFEELMRRAHERLEAGQSKSLFLAIRDIANAERIDLSRFFKNKNVDDIKNLSEKNKILLNILLADSKGKIKQGLDLKGGVSCVLKIDDSKFENLGTSEKTEQLNKAIDIIRQRIDGFGVSEPLLRVFGKNCIEIQLPGISIKDNPEIVDTIKKPAKLEFKLLHPTLVPKSKSERGPIGYEVLVFEGDHGNNGEEKYAFVKRIPDMTGSMVKHAGVVVGQYGEYEISLTMTEEGARCFEKVTAANINRRLGIVLDGKLYSAPSIRSAITSGRANINGNFSQRNAFELSNILNNPLEFELKFVELSEIGPSLAEDARIGSLRAMLIGTIVVAAFMLIFYHTAGIVSLIAVMANIVIILGVMATIGGTLTLPGIAALVLTIGMAVDANILIFERIREELLSGKPLKAALAAGHEKAFSTVLDANLTTLLTAIILIYFGVGPVKGFGVILAIGIFATMFGALVLSKGLLEFLVEKDLVKKLIPDFRIKPTSFDFLKHIKLIAGIYTIVALACIVVTAFRDTKIYGIDFTGGDEITITFEKKIPISEINKLASEHGMGEVTSVYQKSMADNSEILRIQTPEGQGTKFFDHLSNHFQDSKPFLVRKTEIGASVGQGTKLNALISVMLSMVGIMIYVAFRFETGYGIGAVISTIADVAMTILIYLALGHQISAPMIASILMVVGYAINDTIIVFDRIREELKINKSKTLKDIINLSINRTLSRTILTSTSTFLAALALYVFGSGVVVDFALVFSMGVIVGTFSSIFIASPVFYAWHRGDRATITGSSVT
ncbi:MAG: protein translocase subunit SecD [Puniceicoccales bacterium]|jgi:SecD/SecF fusion protein|nr:protein translocase subunit SecD [Puniceicoccales bacterium]